jgi:hypothetical protein
LKGENPVLYFEGACVYITSNKLPALAYDDNILNFDWPAVKVRVNFYKALHKHKDTGSFPINAPILAHLFMDLLLAQDSKYATIDAEEMSSDKDELIIESDEAEETDADEKDVSYTLNTMAAADEDTRISLSKTYLVKRPHSDIPQTGPTKKQKVAGELLEFLPATE